MSHYSRDRQKDRELKITERFISNERITTPIIHIKEGGEPPDLEIALLGDKKISIELSELYDQKLKQRQEFQNKIIALAEHKFLEIHGIYLRVYITFSNEPMRGALNALDSFVELIFDFVEKVYLHNCHLEFRIGTLNSKPPNRYIKRITIDNDITFSNWQSFSAFKVDYINPDLVLNRVKRKEKGLKNYKGQYEENWLLLVANFGSKASAFRYEQVLSQPLNTKFDRVYIYEYFQDIVHEIKLL